ncbi:MAG: hypothetical protein KAJ19_28020, partial [Gammaproteobacteria bacterium]|nr:hypothetical protein [Gammaproteobacteria bacterium]
YVESPYKQQFEEEQAANDLLQFQVQELEAVNTTVTNMMYVLCMATAAFVVVTILLVILNRKARVIPQPAA